MRRAKPSASKIRKRKKKSGHTEFFFSVWLEWPYLSKADLNIGPNGSRPTRNMRWWCFTHTRLSNGCQESQPRWSPIVSAAPSMQHPGSSVRAGKTVMFLSMSNHATHRGSYAILPYGLTFKTINQMFHVVTIQSFLSILKVRFI